MQKVKVGFVGLGFGQTIIEHVVSGSGSSFFELAGVCDLNLELTRSVSAKYAVPAFSTLEDMLAEDDIRVIVLMTGPNGRAGLLRKIIRAGKDCMTTKPFEVSAHEAASVLAEARELGRFIYLNSPCIAETEDLRVIRDWREKYELGMPVGAHHECWYHRVQQADGSWYDDPEKCPAAPVLRLGIYGINDMLRILGEPEEVQVMQSRLFTGRPTADYARMNIKFSNGAIADTVDGWVTSPERGSTSLTLYFENGTIYRNPTMMPCDPVRVDVCDSTYLCVSVGNNNNGMPVETLRIPNEKLSQNYQWDVFYEAVRSRQRPVGETPDSVIVDSVRILEAMKIAAETGSTVKVSPLSGHRPESQSVENLYV